MTQPTEPPQRIYPIAIQFKNANNPLHCTAISPTPPTTKHNLEDLTKTENLWNTDGHTIHEINKTEILYFTVGAPTTK